MGKIHLLKFATYLYPYKTVPTKFKLLNITRVKMGFKLFLVFVALTAVINLSGRCRGQSLCWLTDCGKLRKEVRNENS